MGTGLRPQVGVAVFCWREGRLLAQRRGLGFGTGCWSVPGGAQEHGETFEEAGIREVREETGLEVSGLTVAALTNDMAMPLGGEHWLTVWLHAARAEGEPVATAEATEFRWCTLGDLPHPLFQPHWGNLLNHVALGGIRAPAKSGDGS
jgi:ADP-ribose pyrophosphatase YjhB (NUDIX family)